MALSRAELLAKIAKSSASGGGNNLRDGRGRIAIRSLKLEDGFKGSRFVMEGVVVTSAKIPVTELKTGAVLDITPNEPGTDLSWIQMLDEHESAFGNVKGFVLAMYGSTEAEVTAEDLVETLEELTEQNSAHGMVIDFSTYRKVTNKNKVEITIPKWATVEQTPEDIAKTRAWLSSLVAAQKAG